MPDVAPGSDAFVATVGDPRHRVQCADILLSDQPSRRAALRWISSMWTDYPGCVVAAARHRQGRWCFIASRDGGVLLLLATRLSTVDILFAESVARARYGQWVTGGAAR
jgi:hypothetical protein